MEATENFFSRYTAKTRIFHVACSRVFICAETIVIGDVTRCVEYITIVVTSSFINFPFH